MQGNQLTSLARLTLPLSLTVLDTTGNPIVDLDGLEFDYRLGLGWVGIDDVSYLWTQGSHINLNQTNPPVAMFKKVSAPLPPPPREQQNNDNEEDEEDENRGGKRKKQHKQTKKNKKKYRRKTKKNGIKNERRRRKKVKS